MTLIDKYTLVAEIKTRIETYNKGYANGDDRRADDSKYYRRYDWFALRKQG